ncbi:MAG: tail fiber domain-containing protein [Salinivirgaceae bacterium]|nr:tail fiber domain-containing protein [Salinivirgaceae bacterium]
MSSLRKLLVAFATVLAATATMAQNGFNYQAVIRDANGNLLADQDIALRITLATEAETYYQETQTVRSNAYGAISVIVGEGTVVRGSLSNVPWNSGNVYMKTEFDPTGVGTDDLLVTISTTKLQSVPVAEYAKKTSEVENPTNIKIQASSTTGDDEALFEVKDNDGKVVFAVYKSGVRVYVDENDSKAAKSGFAVAGRSAKGGEGNTYFAVNNEGTKVFVDSDSDDGDKAPKSKFAVSSVKSSKDGESVADNYLVINNEGTKVFVDGNDYDGDKAPKSKFAVSSVRSGKADKVDDFFLINNEGTKVFVDSDSDDGDKAPKSKFAVSSVRSSKADQADDFFLINNEGTKVFIDETPASGGKAPKSKFAVSSVKSSKTDDNNSNYFVIDSDSTRIYIDEAGNSKAAKSGFAVAGKRAAKDGETRNLFNIDLDTAAQVLNGVNRIYWYPNKNAFMAGNLKVENPAQVGVNSFSAGYQNTAKGRYSQAMGYKSQALGDYTTAIGRNAIAEAENAYAFGNSAQAQGKGSYAIGAGATAVGMGSFAIGSVGQDSLNNPLPAPQTTGDYSIAIGAGTQAQGMNTLAMGVGSVAQSKNSVAIGYQDTALANCIAMGIGSKAFGLSSIAIGYNTKSDGLSSTAIGYSTIASGLGSTALGIETTASSFYSTSLGSNTTASGPVSTAMGFNTTASGSRSTAMGYYTTAIALSEVVVGQLNTDYGSNIAGVTDTWVVDAPLFVVGNGTADNSRSDALIITKKGNMFVYGDITYSGSCVHHSDLRLKKDVETIGGALDKVLQLRGVTYYWKNKEEMAAAKGKDVNNFSYGFSSGKQIGIIAQEIEQVVPELVVTDNDGFKAVRYDNIAPLLIEAIKEQQTIIERQQKENDEMKARMEKMEKMLEELMKKQ